MATSKSSSFSSMLNEYLTYDLLVDEFKTADNWLLKNCNWDKSWQGGTIPIPIQVGIANSVKMGGLTADTDIASAHYVRGELTTMKEAYGSLAFHSRDLFEHGKVSEQNFLRLLPDQLTQLIDYFKQTISLQVLGGKVLDLPATAWDSVAGTVAVQHPERFYLNQKVIFADTDTTVTGYVKAINKNTGVLTVVTARGGATPVTLTNLTEADTKIYTDGAQTEYFSSLKDMVLPASLGGSDTFAGLTKLDYPYTQSVLYDATASTSSDWGSATAVTKSTILNLIFHARMKGVQRNAKPKVALCSLKHVHAAMAALEAGSGPYRHVGEVAHFADYTEITVGGVQGNIKLVGIKEFEDSWIAMIDPQFLDLKTGKQPFQVMESPDGLKYYTIRSTTGFQYITDIRLAGDFIYRNPASALIVHSIPAYTFN